MRALFAPQRVAQLAERLVLDLPDALAREVVLSTDLLERQLVAAIQTEAQPKRSRLDRR